jgi:hypothetical protein
MILRLENMKPSLEATASKFVPYEIEIQPFDDRGYCAYAKYEEEFRNRIVAYGPTKREALKFARQWFKDKIKEYV